MGALTMRIHNLNLINESCQSGLFTKICNIINRQIKEHTTGISENETINIVLAIDDKIGIEGYMISKNANGDTIILGNDQLGLIFGVGRYLHVGGYSKNGFIPGECFGISIPKRKTRGMYLANPSWNYYGQAPMEDIEHYIEDLMLWGCNSIMVTLPRASNLNENNEEKLTRMHSIKRTKDIIAYAKNLGMTVAAIIAANLSFSSPPVELLADWTGGHDGYLRNLAAHTHTEICPSKPGGLDYILKGQRESLREFIDFPPDIICLWPYDAGGCTCNLCKPWGGNGFIKVSKALSKLIKQMFSKTEIMISTWYFDLFTSGEWNILKKDIDKDKSWLDLLMVHFNMEMGIPECVTKEGRIPGSVPAIDFPEISMFGCVPWGGFGANPLPNRLQSMWDMSKKYLNGGYPYSEGIFDDINKVICLQFYWGDYEISDIIRQYVSYEFSSEIADDVLRSIILIEQATSHIRIDEEGKQHVYPDPLVPWIGEQRFIIDNTDGIEEAYMIIQKADQKIPDHIHKQKRWRMLYLRAICDYELLKNDFFISDKCEEALHELTDIYLAKNYPYHLSPPTRESIQEARGIFTI
ncbi:MAG: hypothetical protein SCM11_02925 [Bacillota bacterium]|nr:hypothetical protein [Bacillota bacterium]